MRLALAIIAFFAVPALAAAQESTGTIWFVGSSTTSNGRPMAATFVDTQRITVSGSIRRAWVIVMVARDAPGAFVGVSEMMALTEYDCFQQRTRSIQITTRYIDPNHGPLTSGIGEWSYVTPQTAGETEFRFVCSSEEDRAASDRYVLLRPGISLREATDYVFGRINR